MLLVLIWIASRSQVETMQMNIYNICFVDIKTIKMSVYNICFYKENQI